MKQLTHAGLALALVAGAGLAHADRGRLPTPMNPTYTNECGSCHLAYPPGLLPAPSWERLMGRLSSHFGADASVDPSTQRALAAWLSAQAGAGRAAQAAPPEDRITRSAWFEREHRRIAPSVWRRPSIGSASNCAACHRDAAQASFDDDTVAIPR